MVSKVLLSFLLIIMFSSYLHVGLCENSLDQLLPGLSQGAFLQDAKCMQKLLPCQEYVKSPNNPSQACCAPLKEMHENETQCLCNFINYPQLLESISVSKEDIIKLPQACGINVNLSKCKTGGARGEDTVRGDDTAEVKDSTSSTKMITPNRIIYFGVPGFVATLTALVFSSC
ncbi:Lipid transfer protein VAS [Spatholobus suberectus]|nr:Lipid transfer protein VAS [Spatholobus suberectus]